MSSFKLDRRTLLRGMGGIALALPALEIMRGGPRRAHAAATRRFVLSYAGISTGAYKPADQVVPDAAGPNYDVKRGLQPLLDMNIRDDVSVVSGLVIPWSTTDAEAVPPGGRSRFFHFNTVGPQIAGTATPATRDGKPRAPSADQLVANAIAGTTAHKVLAYRVQPVANHADAGRFSWKAGTGSQVFPQEPFASPRLAFQSLFAGFQPPSGGGAPPADNAKALFLLRQRKSVLDFVAQDMTALAAKLGQADKLRMQRHLDEVRGLEKRLDGASTAAPMAGATCRVPAMPGADPAVGAAGNYAYNGEDQRADAMTDLIAMAFACDLSRVASFMITEWKCYMNAKSFTGIDSDMHELTHGAGPLESVSDSVAWHIKQWGKLITKLKAIREPDGSTLLDNTALVLLFEGGHGADPESNKTNSAHSTENMTALIAGRAGGLKSGQHVKAAGKHPAHVVISGMNAAGVTGDTLGQIKGNLPALFG
jgi:hypothetical protein